MPQIIVKQAFKFAHHGHQVEAFEPAAEPVETTDECAELAIVEGWAEAPAPDAKAAESAPQTRDAARQRSTKAVG